MALFQTKDPRTKLESQLKAKINQRDDNAARLTVAETKLGECRATVERLAIEADDAALDRALQAKRSAEDKVGALTVAIAKLGREVVDIEAQIAAERDRLMRHETSEAVKAVAVRVDGAMATFDDAVRDLETALREASLIVLEANEAAAYVANVGRELPPSIVVMLESLRQHVEGVLSGRLRASLPAAPIEPPPLKLVPAVPMQSIFTMKPARYRNADGRQVALGAHRVYDLPAPIAKRALEMGAAIAVTDPRRRTFEGQSGMITPELSRCVALDDSPLAERKSDAAPIASSSLFEPQDRGPAYNVAVPRSMIEPVAMGACSMKSEDEQ